MDEKRDEMGKTWREREREKEKERVIEGDKENAVLSSLQRLLKRNQKGEEGNEF